MSLFFLYQWIWPATHTIILIANFDSPETKNYGVTDIIIDRLREATRKYPDIKIQALRESIDATQGSNFARTKGREHKAGIVLWGWYRKTTEKALITVHFEVLKPPSPLQLRQEKESLNLAVAELLSFTKVG
jgi:hypothetical protein